MFGSGTTRIDMLSRFALVAVRVVTIINLSRRRDGWELLIVTNVLPPGVPLPSRISTLLRKPW